ncbi:MAG: bifunctional diaminohydroxyphosphoribosylaminopyrimidine deaminase/5-amino-6-(5-phosphoribosylamino)uracil reductase RibD [Dysgonamonadaceae bacterium]|nr:bifunctional diaminohydroxyphosphoribosylaminopyrimidine deaminase/5-amino-6-(5-phosphoribosylamino)uracil reductase RibD [Dysgonamonadaceae bacterium]
MEVGNKYMYRCLELAKKGKGFVSPNPMVGAVIVYENKIIGEGFHRKYGQPHAEVNAINAVKNQNLLKKATLYVNLEPCSHYGKTPPCAELIIKKQIPKVVVGIRDPFPSVSGRGIQMMRDAGIEVIVDVLKVESEQLNVRFFTFINKKRPYIILKWAQSSDGFIDKKREINDGQLPVKISNDLTQLFVHKLRAEESAIIVGSRTLTLDKPLLNVRHWNGNDPVKIKADKNKPLSVLMQDLYDEKIQSLIVEGGAALLSSFIEEGLWDEANIEINTSLKLYEGVKAPEISGSIETVQKCKKSAILYYKP